MKFGKEDFEVVHSTPSYPRGYEYVKNAGVLKYNSLWSQLTLGGHTHRPSAYIYTKEIRTVNASVLMPCDSYDMRLMLIEKQSTNKVESFAIEQGKGWKYYVNVGSVGQPRDGNPKPVTCYLTRSQNSSPSSGWLTIQRPHQGRFWQQNCRTNYRKGC